MDIQQIRDIQRRFKTESDESEDRSKEHTVAAAWEMYHLLDRAVVEIDRLTVDNARMADEIEQLMAEVERRGVELLKMREAYAAELKKWIDAEAAQPMKPLRGLSPAAERRARAAGRRSRGR